MFAQTIPFSKGDSNQDGAFPNETWQANRTFHHNIDIYLKDSNAYGNTYFARYFEWQGVCRERWFNQCIQADMLQHQGVFVTKLAHQDYVHESFPFQTVACDLNVWKVNRCSFYLIFRFKVGNQTVSHGYQHIVFTNHEKHIQRLPDDVIAKVREFEFHPHSCALLVDA